jgi:NAD(P)-dependent dehydrogenase (short-subunit alcohol dehydrogenase family)
MSLSVVITGAGGGLGAAMAARFAAEGWRVALLDRRADLAEAEAAKLPGAIALGVDVTDEPAVEAAIEQVCAAFGEAPDALVNNAGIVRFGPLMDHSVEDFRAVLDVNLTGTFIVTRAVARRMIPRGRGAVVNITSLNAVAPSPDAGAYPCSKAAVALLTQHFALALGPHGIRVNAVGPGFIDAGMSAPIYADPAVREVRGRSVPLGTVGRAQDVAETVLFLASDKAAYVHGQHVLVDGGVSFSLKNHLPRKPPKQAELR